MKTLSRYLVSAAALFLVAASLAQEKVKLNLHVVESETAKPVAGYRALVFDSYAVSGLSNLAPDGQWTGDAQGEVTVEFRPGDTNGYYRRLQVRHPDYVSLERAWYHYPRSGSAQSEPLPAEYTMKLERGVTVGGAVKDEQGNLLAAVRVFPLRYSYQVGAPAHLWPAWPAAYLWGSESNEVHALTDPSGRWQLDRFPSALDGLAFAFVRPDQSFVNVYTATSQDRYIGHSGPVVPLSEFLSGKAEVVLPRGYAIQGKVTGADGEPLAGVTLSESLGRNPGIVARTVTGPDGRFNLPNRPAKEIVLVARAPGRALVVTHIMVEAGLPEIRLVLRPQQAIAEKVVDGEGRPIVGARVSLNGYGQQQPGPLEWEGTTTDTEGRFRWDAGPFEPTELFVVPTNGPMRKVTLRAGEPERTIVIRSDQAEFIRLTGTVVDAETKEPLKRFTVVSAESSSYSFDFKSDGLDGKLEVKLPRSAWRENFLPAAEMQFIADGYASQPIGRVDFREGDRELHVVLKRGDGQLAGVVLQPDGKPAEGAKMELTRGSGRTFMNLG